MCGAMEVFGSRWGNPATGPHYQADLCASVADARLITNAPKLYQAASEALDYMRLHKYADQAWADDLETALANARGESK